jgi:multisubunit Na+/H+ antiporter MnhB subunit
MADKTDSNNGFQKLFIDVKDFVDLKIDYLQVGLVEKLTRLVAKLLISITSVIIVMAILFYLLFALAYALAPTLGFIASYAIIAGIFFLILVIVLVFRKELIVNPLLKLMVDLFYDETKNLKNDEDDAETL